MIFTTEDYMQTLVNQRIVVTQITDSIKTIYAGKLLAFDEKTLLLEQSDHGQNLIFLNGVTNIFKPA